MPGAGTTGGPLDPGWGPWGEARKARAPRRPRERGPGHARRSIGVNLGRMGRGRVPREARRGEARQGKGARECFAGLGQRGGCRGGNWAPGGPTRRSARNVLSGQARRDRRCKRLRMEPRSMTTGAPRNGGQWEWREGGAHPTPPERLASAAGGASRSTRLGPPRGAWPAQPYLGAPPCPG